MAMDCPLKILPEGTKIRTHAALEQHSDFRINYSSRRQDEIGTIKGCVGGMGGDVYWVRHEDGSSGAYCFTEFELEGTAADVYACLLADE